MTPRKVVYIAGPIRAGSAWLIEKNIRVAEEYSLMVWKAGMAAICPHTMGRFFTGAAPDDVWLSGDLAIIDRCDAVLFIPDWEASKGSVGEHDYAKANGVPCFYSVSGLIDWMNNGDGVPVHGEITGVSRAG